MKPTKVYNGVLKTVRGLESITFILFDENDNPILESMISLQNLGALLYNNNVPCVYIPTGIDRIGKKTETKQAEIFVPYGPWDQRETKVDEALAPFEIDGWFANRRDLQDPKRFITHENNLELKGAFYDVRFERYIEDSEADDRFEKYLENPTTTE